MSCGSKIFERYKALGYVCNDLPVVVRYIKSRNESLFVTSIGKCFHTYGCNRMSLLSVSGHHSGEITCLTGDTFHIYTACDSIIYAWRRGTEIKHTFKGHLKPIHILLPLGASLLSVDDDSILKVWDVKSEECILEFPFSNDDFKVTCVMHPATYLNKILLGSKQGSLQLLNIHTSTLIYTFSGWNSEITVLEQAPAIDVVAVGLANGRIIVHNIKFDETIVDFTQDWGSVSCISFRTDGKPFMLSGSLSGYITLWNLEERNCVSQLFAHHGAVSGMKCLQSEPLMVTSSPDNSLKVWIFDMPDGGPRLLRFREGHSSPPSYIRYHGSDGHNILSAGEDSSLRIFSTLTETFNKSLGIAYSHKKKVKKLKRSEREYFRMPPITSFTFETTREKEWDDIAAIHDGLYVVTTWSYDKVKMGDLKLIPKDFKSKNIHKIKARTKATCLCLSSCGNFVIIGYSSGRIHKFNIQSGIHRGTYGKPLAHTSSVQGIASDAMNQVVISGGCDAVVKFWPFRTGGSGVLSEMELNEPILFFNLHRESSLLAAAMENYQVIVIDLDTRKIIRKFSGHAAQITDMTWSPDGRWLLTASMDCTIRTWDIPSAHLVDIFKVDAPCTSLSLSPTGDRLATAHVDHLGVFLWSNKTLFENIYLRPIFNTTDIAITSLPAVSGNIEESNDLGDEELNNDTFKSPDQISDDLVTLSLSSNSRWQNLLNLDIIQRRNKPKAALTKPKSAPFFLPTIPSLDLQFDLRDQEESNIDIRNTSIKSLGFTVFGKMLHTSIYTSDFKECIEKLKSLGLSGINFEVESLSEEVGGSEALLLQFMKLIEAMLTSNKDFELAQSYLGLFLKKHGDFVITKTRLFTQLYVLKKVHKKSWEALQNKLLYSLCVVGSLKNM